MRTHPSIPRGVLVLFVLLVASSPAAAAEGDHVKGAMILAPASQLNVIAPGSDEDTLKACLGRIPLDASVGQRLLAEQSCAAEEGTRKLLPGSEKF